VVIPALIVFVMVMGAFGTSVVPRASPDSTGEQQATSTRAANGVTPLDTATTSSSSTGVSGDSVSNEVVVNENALGRTDIRPEPSIVRNDLKDQKDSGLSFTSSRAPTSTVIRSDPEPLSLGVDAGGPYGGPDTYEGDTIHFVATVDDPSLIMFRWDFNGDGKWDTGTKTGGYWITQTEIDYQYLDMYSGLATVEAWDGFSTKTTTYTSWSQAYDDSWAYGFAFSALYWTAGYYFTPKMDLRVSPMAYWRYAYGYGNSVAYGRAVTIWQVSNQAKITECSLESQTGYYWKQCTNPSATLYAGVEYAATVWLGSGAYDGYYYLIMNTKPSDESKMSYGAVYYYIGGTSPQFPQYYYTDGYTPKINMFLSWDIVFPLTVSDTATVEVHNVAPIVYDFSVSPAQVLEGNPATFSAMFYDPGLAEKWQYRWCWGDGTCDDWAGIRVGSGISQLANILVYSDVAPHYARMALDYYGATYTFTASIYDLPTLVPSRQWDLIIYQSYYIAYIAPTIEDFFMTQIAGGAMIMYNNWYANNRATHPFMAWLGAQVGAGYTTAQTMYVWEPAHQLFNTPTSVPMTLNPTHDQYYTDGFRVTVLSNAFDPIGYTANRQAGQVSMTVRNDCQGIFNAFTPQNFQGDQNFDGDPDMYELLVNELRCMVGPEIPPSMPWPVPPTKHTYRDDDPISGTPFDPVTATLEVKDSNHDKLMGGTITDVTTFPNAGTWPAGWTNTGNAAWRSENCYYLGSQNCASWWYYYDYSGNPSYLTSKSYDLSGMDLGADVLRVKLSYNHYWWANYDGEWQDGYVEVSADNFATSTLVAEYHHNDPGTDGPAVRSFDIAEFAGVSNLRVRFSIQGYDDYGWFVDDVTIDATWGTIINGLGSGTTDIMVYNVEPKIVNGPTGGVIG